MAVIKGKDANVKIYSDAAWKTVSYLSTVNWSGYTTEGVELNIVGLDYKLFKPIIIDSGTIEITGYYDPADEGQIALNAAGDAGTELHFDDIKIELNSAGTTYVAPASGSTDNYWIVLKWSQVNADAKDIDKTVYTLRCSGQSTVYTTT